MTICHATGQGSFVELSVGGNELTVHSSHEDDLIPAPEGGCSAPQQPLPTLTATPTQTPSPAPTTAPTATPTPDYALPVPTRMPGDVFEPGESPTPSPTRTPTAATTPEAGGGAAPATGATAPSTLGPGEAPGLTGTADGLAVRGTLADTGSEPGLISLLGLGLVLSGAGLRLRTR